MSEFRCGKMTARIGTRSHEEAKRERLIWLGTIVFVVFCDSWWRLLRVSLLSHGGRESGAELLLLEVGDRSSTLASGRRL